MNSRSKLNTAATQCPGQRLWHASRFAFAFLAIAFLATTSHAQTQVRIKSICRLKGQEQNTLQGMGLVVGLKGTGDGGASLPTIRSLAKAMELMGHDLGSAGLVELKDAKNVALVLVAATVPAAGARQGDELECTVSSVGGAKSLLGGTLLTTALLGPRPPAQPAPLRGRTTALPDESPIVYATAQGRIHLDDPQLPVTGRIHRGCRLEAEFFNEFVKDGHITLVLNEHHADFEVAQDIADEINDQLGTEFGQGGAGMDEGLLARALSPQCIEVTIPEIEGDYPVPFVSRVLAVTIVEPQTQARVVVNKQTGSIVIGADVEIGSAVVSHKNIVIETGDNLPADRFIPIDPGGTRTTPLKALVEALDAVKVPTADIIDIIQGLERNGKLHGQLVIE